jgi:large subunit ribosomal protein L25
VRIGDLVPPRGVEFLTDPDTMVLAVVEPAVMDTELDLAVAGEEAPEEAAEAAPEEEAEAAAAEETAEGEGEEAGPDAGAEGESEASEGDGES